MKKFLTLVVVLTLVLTLSSPLKGEEGISVSFENTLNIPIFRVITFKVKKDVLPNAQSFSLLNNGVPLPLYFSEDNNEVTFKTALSLGAKEKKVLKLVPEGSNFSKKDFYIPNFIGTHFVIPQKGKIFIVSYEDGNQISIVDTRSNKVIFEKDLDALNFTSVDLTYDSIFALNSTKQCFAEFSTLTPPFDKNSSDDVSAVFGTFFKLYIPKVLFVTSITDTNLKITDSNGNTVFDTLLKANSFYANTKLAEGVYTITADHPVLVEYGYADDNVFSTLYGIYSTNVILFGGLGISSIFDNTTVSVKLDDKTSTFTLEKANDFKYLDVLSPSEFKPNTTEYKEVSLSFSKPVLIYTYSQYGNVDGEQIPSFNDGTIFKFHTGIVTKIYGERQRRVVIVGSEENTNINLNGNNFSLNSYKSKTFLFKDSFSSVNITSSKPIAVFDLGIEGNKEIFTTLLPLDSPNTVNVTLITNGGTQTNGTGQTTPNVNTNQGTTNKDNFFDEVKNYLSGILKNVSVFFTGIFTQSNVNNILDVIKTFFKGVATNILGFLRPISEKIYQYISNYIPGLTVDIISSAIFALFILLIIILLVPKGKKERIPVVNVEEVKKKPIAFNVKDLEVKEGTQVEEIKATPGEIHEEIPKVKTIPIRPPEDVIKETPKEEIELTHRVFRPAPPRRTEKLTIEKQKIETPQEKVPQEQKPEIEVEEKLVKEEEVTKPEEKIPETEKKEFERKTISSKITEEIIEGKPEEVLKPPEEKTLYEQTVPKEEIEKVENKEIVHKPPVEVSKEVKEEEHEVSFADFAQPNLEEIQEIEEKSEKEKVAPYREKVVSEEHIEEKSKKEEFKSTFEELLRKLEEENRKKREEKVEKVPTNEENVELESKPAIPETKHFTKIELKTKYVSDASSLRKIYESSGLPQEIRNDLLSKACISASQKSEVIDIVEGRFRITVIGLTTIEERLAEDIARRVSGKYTTGEAILIAKKLRLTDIVVDDKPKLKNYQGINIYSLDEII
ncbi:hypothetical protein [Caldisericum exile]|uniref:Uncharacterized protein n=1 Tax=Caldisericum exile (strain DSM 21853 / NBRC 104410 / AZM16c01) TaxID=511051 RepID=A0A7U6GFD0_CALEA|nr:hypothetical protein [Caldisericum exile]BAL81329.1 hypothetical protein CSE_12030 [Caldisericum exile AZM16c01]